jgi:hypothetical protein
MKEEWNSSWWILSRVALAGILCIYLGLFPISADLAPGQAGSGSYNFEEGTSTISVIAPEGFTWVLGVGTNNDTSKIASITVADYDGDVYLKVHDASTPSGGEAGHMYSSTEENSLKQPLFMGEKDKPASMVALSGNQKRIYTFKDTPGAVNVHLDLGQATGYTDPAASDYAITVTFTATATA